MNFGPEEQEFFENYWQIDNFDRYKPGIQTGSQIHGLQLTSVLPKSFVVMTGSFC